jgi:lysozyme family protein
VFGYLQRHDLGQTLDCIRSETGNRLSHPQIARRELSLRSNDTFDEFVTDWMMNKERIVRENLEALRDGVNAGIQAVTSRHHRAPPREEG